jgi:hypothetical protein
MASGRRSGLSNSGGSWPAGLRDAVGIPGIVSDDSTDIARQRSALNRSKEKEKELGVFSARLRWAKQYLNTNAVVIKTRSTYANYVITAFNHIPAPRF